MKAKEKLTANELIELETRYISYLVAKRRIFEICGVKEPDISVEWLLSGVLDIKTMRSCQKAVKCST